VSYTSVGANRQDRGVLERPGVPRQAWMGWRR